LASWPRPERLLPPRLHDALASALGGDAAAALARCSDSDARDPLTSGVVRLLRALSTLEAGEHTRGRRELRALVRQHSDPGLTLVAVAALGDDLALQRRFVPALRLLRAAQLRQRDRAARLYLAALQLGIELQRRGTLEAAAVGTVARKLERTDPAPVHAAVHVLRAEYALLAGDLAAAVAAHREARPYARSGGIAALRRRQEAVAQILRAPFADVEDWEEPLRTVSREELAAIEARPWRLWVDGLHRVVRRRGGTSTATLALGPRPAAWRTLQAVLRTPRHHLPWANALDLLGETDVTSVRDRASELARVLREVQVELQLGDEGFALPEEKLVLVFAPAALPSLELDLLGRLAEKPGARTAALARGGARRTVVRHLARLRAAGYVRMAGGGNEARYFVV
jgi:hypothetical protein